MSCRKVGSKLKLFIVCSVCILYVTMSAEEGRSMRIQWLGHSSFRITADNGFSIVTDPFDETVGYPMPTLPADAVTISHDHFDHNHAEGINGKPQVVRGSGRHSLEGRGAVQAAGIGLNGIASFHDNEQGRRRGRNTIFVIEMDGVRIVHLGDLGHRLTPEQIGQIGRVDVLLVPVGGTFTVDAQGAAEVVEQLDPRIVIPMHYKTDALSFPIDGVEPFLKLSKGVEQPGSSTIEIAAEDLPKAGGRRTVVLSYR